jgi:hypothetical protein
LQETIRVEAPDLRSAMRLVEQATPDYVTELVPLQRDGWEVRVSDPDGGGAAFADVIGLVDRWLEAADVPTTTVHGDGHVYTLNRRVAATVA